MWNVLRGAVIATIVTFLGFTLLEFHSVRVPSGVWFMDLVLCIGLATGARLVARTIIERPRPGNVVARGKEVVVIGAGDAAQLVVREMLRNPSLGATPIGLLDDDPRKKNMRIHGVRVLGTTEKLTAVLNEYRPDEVLIAVPSASGSFRQSGGRHRQQRRCHGEDAAEPLGARQRRLRPRGTGARGRGRGRPRSRAGRGRSRVDRRLPRW